MNRDSILRFGWYLGRGLFAVLFLAGGVGHFVAPATYLRIMPPSLPQPLLLVYLSGLAELGLGGLLLFRGTQVPAAWGLIALLVAVFPANWFMWQHAERFPVSPTLLLMRLPMQGLLIAWAWAYTRTRSTGKGPVNIERTLALVALLAGSIGGCGFGTASLPRFDRGELVRAESLNGEPIIVFFAKSEETVAPGTVVRVVADDEETTATIHRKVIVGFQGGPHEGLAGMIRRSDLQPSR